MKGKANLDPKLVEFSDLLGEAVERYGGRKELAFRLRENQNTLNGQLNPFNARNALQVKLLLNIIQETVPYSTPAVQYLCHLASGIFVKLPEVYVDNPEGLKDLFLKTSEELADVATELRRASSPNSPGGREITFDEYPALIKELKEVLVVIFEMLYVLGGIGMNGETANELCFAYS